MSLNLGHSADTLAIIHGVPVPDPYHWLEDRWAPETESWIEEQRRLSMATCVTSVLYYD